MKKGPSNTWEENAFRGLIAIVAALILAGMFSQGGPLKGLLWSSHKRSLCTGPAYVEVVGPRKWEGIYSVEAGMTVGGFCQRPLDLCPSMRLTSLKAAR